MVPTIAARLSELDMGGFQKPELLAFWSPNTKQQIGQITKLKQTSTIAEYQT